MSKDSNNIWSCKRFVNGSPDTNVQLFIPYNDPWVITLYHFPHSSCCVALDYVLIHMVGLKEHSTNFRHELLFYLSWRVVLSLWRHFNNVFLAFAKITLLMSFGDVVAQAWCFRFSTKACAANWGRRVWKTWAFKHQRGSNKRCYEVAWM